MEWTVKQGLPNGTAFCTIQDKYGFIWIGTQLGLSRFDGNLFKNYYSDLSDPKSIHGEFIEGIKEDSLHNLWIGTDKGLCRYDIQADSFTNFKPLLGENLSNTSTVPFWTTKDEVYCIDADSVISVIDIKSFRRKVIVTFPREYHHNYNISTRNADLDEATQTIWMPADSIGGLYEISCKTGTRTFHNWTCFRNIASHGHWFEGMCLDHKRNCLWLNTEDGLLQFNLSDKKFLDIDPLKGAHSRGVSVSLDRLGRVWVGTRTPSEKMFVLNPDDHQFFFPVWGDSTAQMDANIANSSIYFDHSDMAWITSYSQGSRGIVQLVTFTPSVWRYGGQDSFLGWEPMIGELRDGNLIVADDINLRIVSTKTGSVQVISRKNFKGLKDSRDITILGVSQSEEKIWLIDDRTQSLYQMDAGNLMCKSMKIFDTANRLLEKADFNNRLTVGFGTGLIIAANGSDQMHQALYLVNEQDGTVHELVELKTARIRNVQVINGNLIMVTLRDQNKRLSFQIENNRCIRNQSATDNILTDKLVYDAPDHSWWSVNGRQLVRLDNNLHATDTFSIREGIPEDGNINSLCADANGTIWFNTHTLISALDPKTKRILTLAEKDGFGTQRYFPNSPIVQGASGDLYFTAGYDGLDRISPAKFESKFPPATIYVKSVSVNQLPYPISTGLPTLQDLQLSYKENRIIIETGVLDYYAKGKTRIRYKLEGVNTDWQYAEANHAIRYENLPNGNFHLLIQAANPVGVFNGPIRKIDLAITPPWWKTGWANVLFAAIFISLIWSFMQYRSKQLRARNAALEQKVIHRTKELKHSLDELRDTQNQLVQREKMASLGELTAGVAHEIQNPLNFVKNFSEVSAEIVVELKDEIKAGNYDDAIHIADNIEENLRKVVHHSGRADAIVKGMLMHSRVSDGVKEMTDLNSLVQEWMQLSYHGSKANGQDETQIFLETKFDPNIGTINIVPQDIGRVLLNIFNNAYYSVKEKRKLKGADFKPKVSVATSLLKTSQGKEYAEISISDNGMGIPGKIVEKIFQPFFTTKPTGEGTGLGLSLSYDIITKMHGGELRVESTEGDGAEFVIILPKT